MLVVVASAEPHGLLVLLQEEKQIIPTIQIAINTTFFILDNFMASMYIFYMNSPEFLLFSITLKRTILF